MNFKKIAAIILITAMLFTLAACGNGADIPLSKMSFGMSEERVKAVVKAAPDEEYSDMMLASYKGSIDLAEGSWICSFSFIEDCLDEIYLYKEPMTSEECLSLRDELIRKLSELYSVSQDDWKIENDGYSNYCEYTSESEKRIQLLIRIYDEDGGMSILFIIRANFTQNDEKISVIPKN